MDITEYIRPDAFILIPVLYIIGMFLRQTPRIPFWSHSWIKVIFAVYCVSSPLWLPNRIRDSRDSCNGCRGFIQGFAQYHGEWNRSEKTDEVG